MPPPADIEGLLREAAPRALAAVVRRFGDFGESEDAVQEAMIAASAQWPAQGTPESPTGWLIAVASRRMTGCGSSPIKPGIFSEVTARLSGVITISAG